jgi:uncharacterized Tic20 family protein
MGGPQPDAIQPAEPPKRYRDDAGTALAAGIVSVVLVFPIGIVLGPLAVWSGVTALRGISSVDQGRGGAKLAVAGIVVGAVASCLGALMVVAEIVSLLGTGGLIPAP